MGFFERGRVAVRQHHTGAVGQHAFRNRKTDAACATGHQGDPADHRFRLWHALKFRFFERPVFDPEGFAFRQPDIVPDNLRAAHHSDRIAVKFARETRRRLVGCKGESADPRHQHDNGIGIAH